jgi:nucleoporin NUP159
MASGNAPAIELAPEVPEVETEVASLGRESLHSVELTSTQHLGFKVLNQGHQGPKKVKILPRPWPTEHLPHASASLLSVASRPGLLAAAGPNILVITSTDGVRKAFGNKTASDDNKDESALSERDVDVVSDFTPDVTISTSNLRQVAFSTDGEFLATSAEETGGVAVYDVNAILKQGRKDPAHEMSTENIPVRALLPNTAGEYGQYFAVVLDSGKLQLFNVADGKKAPIREDGVNCTAWSTRGKAVVAGLADGTLAIHMTSGELKGIIPRPPEVDESYEVTGVSWMNTEEFLVVHSVKESQDADEPKKFHFVKSNKGWTSFTFHPFGWDILPPAWEAPSRALPARFSSTRLRNWKPDLDEMLIITSSHADTIGVLASTSSLISPNQKNVNELMLIGVDDTKRATAPRTAYGDEEQDSVFIGEALDLSAKEKIMRPIPALEEISVAPFALPAYMALTHEGLLAAWWVMWNKSIEVGERYPGIVHNSESTQSATASTPAPSRIPITSTSTGSPFGKASDATPKTPFGKSTGTFGTPGTSNIPTFGNTGYNSPTPALMKPTPPGFGTPGFGAASTALPAPSFGKPAQPAFGAASSIGKPAQPAFGAPSAIGKPAQPAFGAPSAVGAGSGFGATGGMGNKSSPWGAPTPAAEPKINPFAAASGGTSGFAKFGQTGGGSSFSSFGSNNGAQSGFGSLGQGQQKSGFGGLKTEPSFGSTVTVGSGTGSSLPSWANTPAQTGSSLFGQDHKSSFNTASFESKGPDVGDAADRKRDEATPTPQLPPKSESKGLFGLAGGFKLGSTFSSDGTAKDDPAKPAAPTNGGFFGSDFANQLPRNGMQPPETPARETPETVSTTPASPPGRNSFFPSAAPTRESETPKAPPPAQERSAPVDDAPLPPDFTKVKPSKSNDDAPLPPDFINTNLPKSKDDDLPPLAGSPGVEVEAPSSSVEVSPIDNEESQEESQEASQEEEDFSDEAEDEEEEEEEDEEQTSPARPVRKASFPPAPTPPVGGASPALFGHSSRPAGNQSSFSSSSLFGQQSNKAPFSIKPDHPSSAPLPNLPPPTNRTQNLRSPSPVRPSSASQVRREPMFARGASLSASVQGSKPPTPQPQVSDLEDEEDERMRAQLAQPIEPSRDLEEFVAYQNYTGGKSPSKTGHAGQIEMIYKDINGMVDALGWNERSIKSFTQYHQQPQPGHKVDRGILDDVQAEGLHGSWFDKFTLHEIQTLGALEKELEQELDAGRVQDVLDKLSQLARLLREKAKLMTRLNDIRRHIINRKDPEKAETLRNAPLPKELADGQKALRKDYAQLLMSIDRAEDEVSILRTKLASQNAQHGRTAAVPTMDAVKRTIAKLAYIAEQKNNDILVLEAQMRKIGLADPSRPSSSSSRTNGTPRRSRQGTSFRNSIADTPYATPPTSRNKLSLSELNRRALTPEVELSPTPTKGYGLFYTPDGSPTSGKEIARLSDLVDENMDSLRETARRRKAVAQDLKTALLDRGIKVTKVN